MKEKSAHELFEAAFRRTRDPRSDAYKKGVYAALEFRLENKRINIPYPIGTAAFDAFISGCDEGHFIWRRNQE